MTAIFTDTGAVMETVETECRYKHHCYWHEESEHVKLFPNDQAARIYCHMERITQFELCEYTCDNSVFGRWGNGVR